MLKCTPMREFTPATLDTPEQQKQFFTDSYETARQVDDQNNRYETLMSEQSFDNHSTVREIARRGLYWEQTETIEQLHAIDNGPYEAIAQQYNQTEAALAEVERQIDEVGPVDMDEYNSLVDTVQQAIDLSPTVKDILRDHLESHPLTIHYNQLMELTEEATRHEDALREIETLFAAAAHPWPVPQIPEELHQESEEESGDKDEPERPDNEADQEPNTEEIVAEENVFPGDRHERESSERIQRMVERYGHTKKASIMTANRLLERAGEILTPLEIGEMVYEASDELDTLDPERAVHVMHTRILTLLNERTSRVPKMLEAEGYKLLYGDRYQITATGKRIGNARRVYMAVPKNDPTYPTSKFLQESSEHLTTTTPGRPTGDVPHINKDTETEDNASETDLDEIEKTVETLTKHDKWSGRVDDYIEKVEQLVPWLEANDLLPAKAGGGVNAVRLKTKFFNKKFIDSAPVAIVQTSPNLFGGEHLPFNRLVYKLLPDDNYHNIPEKYSKAINRRVVEIERQYFDAKESTERDS